MTDTSVDERRQELEAELARLQEQERREQMERREREQTQLEAQLDPEIREQKGAIEARAREALDREYPPAWTPQKAKSDHPVELVGLVLRIDPRVGPSPAYGTYSAVVELRATDSKEWTIWCNEGGTLYAQLLRERIQPGEVVGIRYRGKKESGQNPGYSYHDFRLVRVEEDEGPPAPVDYDALQRDRETPALPAPEDAQEAEDDIPF